MRKKNTDGVIYPLTLFEWRKWIEKNLDIDELKGYDMVEKEIFPLGTLIIIWKQEFSAECGYSPDFIPALTRNKIGFLKWVYSGGSEPNWKKSD